MKDFEPYYLGESLGHMLRVSSQRLKAGLKRAFAAHGYDLTGEQWALFCILWEQEGVSQVELADRVSKDRHNISRMLEVMEHNGWIHRRSDPKDGRCRLVHLTEAGRRLQAVLTPITWEFTWSVFGALGPEEQENLKTMLRRVLARMDELDQGR
jgi:DNA-binding MarR family transcriptional regulator